VGELPKSHGQTLTGKSYVLHGILPGIGNSVFKLPPEERKKRMKVYYDDEVDALYLKLGDETPEGVIEISEGVNLDTTSEDKIVGIEILDASKKIDLKTMLSYTLEFEKDLIIQKTA
jgi:uncharacterized protein YuzE